MAETGRFKGKRSRYSFLRSNDAIRHWDMKDWNESRMVGLGKSHFTRLVGSRWLDWIKRRCFSLFELLVLCNLLVAEDSALTFQLIISPRECVICNTDQNTRFIASGQIDLESLNEFCMSQLFHPICSYSEKSSRAWVVPTSVGLHNRTITHLNKKLRCHWVDLSCPPLLQRPWAFVSASSLWPRLDAGCVQSWGPCIIVCCEAHWRRNKEQMV